MKQVFANFYLLILLSGISYPQSGWVRQYPPSEAQNTSFLSVSFVDANTGFIVGGSGTILHTANGGTDWVSQLSGTTNWLRGVSASNTNIATAIGDSGIILHTTNDGTTWIHQTSGTTHPLRAVSFTDGNTGSAVGDSGTILRTTNGGATWVNQSSGVKYTLHSVSFVDNNIGTVVGDSGIVLRTTNGGTTWTNQSIATNYQLSGVSFTDSNTGTVVGNYQSLIDCSMCHNNGATILRTTNGGISWERQMPDSLNTVWAQGFPDPICGVSFTDADKGTVVMYNYIFHTTNGGGVLYTDSVKGGGGYWTRQIADSNIYQGVCFTDANTGTVVGAFGIILHTTTGGVTTVNNNPIQRSYQFVLEQNYPNPFNPITVITYNLPISCLVMITVYDVMGREVLTLINEHQAVGKHSITLNAGNLSSGVYFYRIQTESLNSTKKLLLLK
jgi:photosystem II stability/assembly factor-like uncharacterized protein